MPAQQKPPPGILFIEDYEDETGTVHPGIASRLGITPGTFRKWRMAGKAPAGCFLLGKRVAAHIEDIDAYIDGLRHAVQAPPAEARPPETRTARHSRKHVKAAA
ncbi:MAG TPA: hypothetical protein DEQ61_08405 [Streptomyces sp.]|nr:hypothetical protein [Streptomyces sp.]